MNSGRSVFTMMVASLAGGLLSVSAFAQTGAQPPVTTTPATPAAPGAPGEIPAVGVTPSSTQPGVPAVRSSGIPQRDTLARMMRPVTIEFRENRLEDVVKFIVSVTQADVEPMWADDRNSAGLDKDTPITLRQDKGTALDLVIKVLDRAQADSGTHSHSWQLNDSGTFQIGPKERLNKFRYVKLYSIADLLIEVPDYRDAPEFDLQSVLQNQGGRGGGGSSQSPFRENNQQQTGPKKSMEERAKDIQDLLVQLVESEQWQDNGGDGATIRYFQGNLLVNAPDYIHRQIDGYPYWPAADTHVSTVNGRRYVTLGVDTVTNKLNGFTNQPVTAVAGGVGGAGGGGTGGGTGTGGGGTGTGTGGGGTGPAPRPNGTPPRGPR